MVKYNPRAMMERAVKVMAQSIPERRDDGKISPKVGAVLVDIGEEVPSVPRIMEAYRGELREGDHAEFTLLERKNRDRILDTCILFATLEPCAPGARNPPKMSCAERIVLARIKEIWIGIEDPDPTVAQKGIKYLQDNNVKVNLFDRDLQEIIREENKEFLEQALERAAEAEEAPCKIVLSPLESAAENMQIEDFSRKALKDYRSLAKIKESINSEDFQRRLSRQGLLKSVGEQLVPTGFGTILFGEEPRTAIPQSGLMATIHYPDGTEEVKDFDGPQVLVPGETIKWLKDKLPNIIDRSDAVRTQKNDQFFELIREGIVNALVHRDYAIAGAKCQLIVSQNKIEIHSPGKPIKPITFEQMNSFDAPMLSRNPILHYVFAKMDLAEERGLGLKSLKQKTQLAGLPLPKYSWTNPYLVLTLFPNVAASIASLPPEIQDELSSLELEGWKWLTTQGRTNSTDYAKKFGIDSRNARRHLNHFIKLGLVQKTGLARATEYVVLQDRTLEK
ncbi:ATP-binding protein [Gimesia chilikensis]|uniref:Riboflavin biosynthesis protein RibD n=1 Tax=Gimesia chilikensis TaxID=2605989 RepID=A0A517PSW3_9PLAN|nr:ATP-binding protein [Gimesia chilikensis]QDT22467.1 Riboflavin biosynthesis protein RibD [Gimesia chilikensis]